MLAKLGIHVHLGASLWLRYMTEYKRFWKQGKSDVFLSCALIDLLCVRRPPERAIKIFLAVSVLCMRVSSSTHLFRKTEKQQVRGFFEDVRTGSLPVLVVFDTVMFS